MLLPAEAQTVEDGRKSPPESAVMAAGAVVVELAGAAAQPLLGK